MIEELKFRVRSWEQAGKYPLLTRGATVTWLAMQNARDRFSIGNVRNALARNGFSSDPATAVQDVCKGPLGAGIRPMQDPMELTELVRRIKEIRPKRVLEIGTARGGTLLLLCRFAAPDATIVSVDLPYGRNGGGYPRWKEKHYRTFPQPDQELHLLRADSHARETVDRVSAIAGPEGFDFILIDADHSYEGVKRDYLNYSPLLSDRGLLALHDVLPNESDPSIDVNRFWKEIEREHGLKAETIASDARQGMYGIGLVKGLGQPQAQ